MFPPPFDLSVSQLEFAEPSPQHRRRVCAGNTPDKPISTRMAYQIGTIIGPDVMRWQPTACIIEVKGGLDVSAPF